MTSDAARKRKVADRFGRAAGHYSTGEHGTGIELQLLVEVARARGDERVLDLGAGAGHTAQALAPHVSRVTVTDLAQPMLDEARRLFGEAGLRNADFLIADAEDVPFPDQAFDIVTCRMAAHHFLDVSRATGEVARVLKPGGLYFLVDTISPGLEASDPFLHDVESRRDPTHVRDYTEAEWLAICRQAGLQIESVWRDRRRLDVESWLARGGADPSAIAWVRERLLHAPPEIARTFDIVVENGRVRSFRHYRIILAARRQAGNPATTAIGP